MSDMRFWRRDLLKAGAGGMLLVGVGSQAATADTGEKNVLLDEDFRDYEPGDFPTGWDTAGNTDQEVVSSPSLSHDRAFRYSGSAGGCWEAIAQSPEKAAIASEGTTVINGDVRVGSGSHGCHSNTADIAISTCDDGWPCGEKQRFISFADTGQIEVYGADDDLGSWTQNKWYRFTITYERSDGQVTYTVEVEGEETTVEKEEGGFEDEIAHLWLNTGGYTNYVDNVKITYDDSEISGDPGSGSFNAQNGLAINDGTAYLVEDSEIKLVSLDTRSIIDRFDAPDGRPRGLAYGNGSLWFADGVEPDYDGEILELDPDTGRVRSRIDTSYDPRGLAFGENSLWVIDITSNDIEEYSPDGRRVGGFDIRGPTDVTYGRGLAYFDGSLWVGEFAGSDGSSTASLYEFTTDGEFLQETGERTFPDGEGGGYGGLATTSTELLGPDEDGNLTVLRTLGEGDDPDVEANFKFEPESPNIGDTVTFDAGDSSPADAIQEYRWDFTGDGETDATGVTVDRVFEDAEEQTVRLTVVDADGIEASTEKSIEPEDSDDRESKTEIAGTVTDSAGNQLRDIEVRAENQETDDQITTTTNSDGEYEIAVEADSEYRVFVFDQFGLEQTEFEDFVQLEEKETLKLDITLFSKFEVFEEQKLGSDRIAGLAPRIDDLSTPLINEKEDVAAEINYIEDAVDSGNIDQELADEAIERMVVGEAMVNRALEGLTDATPINLGVYDWSQGPLVFEDEMPNFDLLFQTAKGIVIGLIEASYSLKKIAKEALGEFGDLIIDRINSAIGNFIRDRLSDYQRVLETAENALSIGEMLLEIKEAADTAIERINEGATFENKRSVIKDLADPIAEQIANGLLVGAELLSIEGQLSELNTTFSADSLADDPTFTKDIETVVDETQTSLAEIGTKVQQADDAMNPESDALKELINLVRELADAGFTDIPSLLNSIWGIVRDLVSVVSSGFNIGFGIIRSRDIYTDSAGVINDITKTV